MEKKMDIQYRMAELADLEEITALVRQAVLEMSRRGIDQWDELYPIREDFEQDIRRGQMTVGTLAGRAAVIYTINGECDPEYEGAAWEYPDKSCCILHRLCVNPLFQNRGIARQTMEHLERETAAKGIEAIRLDVFSQNPYALKLYRNCGFEKVGTVRWRKGLFYLMEKYLTNQ